MTDSVINPTEIATESQQFSWGWFLFSAKGRISRSDYWLRFFLPYLGISFVLGIVDAIIGTFDTQGGMGVLGAIFLIITIYPSIIVTIKRWHDRDKSGWWILINLVPIIGVIWAFVENGCLKGTEGPNRFGPSRFGTEQNLNQVFE